MGWRREGGDPGGLGVFLLGSFVKGLLKRLG